MGNLDTGFHRNDDSSVGLDENYTAQTAASRPRKRNLSRESNVNRRVMVLCAATIFIVLHVPAANDQKGPWVRHVITEDFITFAASAADFTGDGRVDVIASGSDSGEDILFVAPQW